MTGSGNVPAATVPCGANLIMSKCVDSVVTRNMLVTIPQQPAKERQSRHNRPMPVEASSETPRKLPYLDANNMQHHTFFVQAANLCFISVISGGTADIYASGHLKCGVMSDTHSSKTPLSFRSAFSMIAMHARQSDL